MTGQTLSCQVVASCCVLLTDFKIFFCAPEARQRRIDFEGGRAESALYQREAPLSRWE